MSFQKFYILVMREQKGRRVGFLLRKPVLLTAKTSRLEKELKKKE